MASADQSRIALLLAYNSLNHTGLEIIHHSEPASSRRQQRGNCGMKFLDSIRSISVLGLMSFASSHALAEANCHDRALISAIAARQVQTQLMVGALQCRGKFDVGQRQIYDAYLERFGGNLKTEHEYLIERYRERHGPEATKRIDAYLTSLANQASLALLKEPNRCTAVAVAGRELIESKSVDWVSVRSELPIMLSDQDNGICSAIDFSVPSETD